MAGMEEAELLRRRALDMMSAAERHLEEGLPGITPRQVTGLQVCRLKPTQPHPKPPNKPVNPLRVSHPPQDREQLPERVGSRYLADLDEDDGLQEELGSLLGQEGR